MKKIILIVGIVFIMLVFSGCQQKPQVIGGDKDSHGCLIGAGYSWCDAKEKCIRPWEENCTSGCGTCPLLSQPAPTFCTDGKIIDGGKDQCGCNLPPKCDMTKQDTGNQIANPASVFCEKQGGQSTIVTSSDGSQSGVCLFTDGTTCDEWAYFRGDCPEKHICTPAEKAAEMCTMEYAPVCGDDGVTYGNKCSACGSKVIDSYVGGECPDKSYVSRDLEQCKLIKFSCGDGKVYFSDEFGCGCEAVSNGKLKATDCLPEERAAACTKEYIPVCGWFDQSIQCIKYPCAANYGNKCTACSDEKVAYWTESECPSEPEKK